VDVLCEVSEATTATQTETDLLRVYEVWNNTGSEKAARTLERTGIKLTKDRKRDS
jgi:hypothetical protein